MTLCQEKWYPATFGLVAGAVFFACEQRMNWRVPTTMPNLLSSVINVCAIAIGFLGTAQSILVSMEDRQVMMQLKDAGTHERIVSYVMRAIVWSFWLAALSAVLMLADWPTLAATGALATTGRERAICVAPLSLWIFLLVTASLAYYRIISLFAKILRIGSGSSTA